MVSCFLREMAINTTSLFEEQVTFLLHPIISFLSSLILFAFHIYFSFNLFPIYLSADRCEAPFIEANGCEKKRYLQLFMTIQLSNSTEFCVNEMLKLFHLTTVLDCCDN